MINFFLLPLYNVFWMCKIIPKVRALKSYVIISFLWTSSLIHCVDLTLLILLIVY